MIDLLGRVLDNKSIPWMLGRHSVIVVEKRVPKEGEYMLSGNIVVQRKGSAFLSKTDAKREYWIVEVLPLSI